MESRLERQLRLVELARARGAFRFGRAMTELQPISTATLTRLLVELQDTGMLQRLPDGGYAVGARPAAWALGHDNEIPSSAAAMLDDLRTELSCTVTLWTIHAQAQRCVYRALDEFSPSFAEPGVVRPLIITAGSGGLFMAPELLADLTTLQAQVARVSLRPSDQVLKRIVRGCLHDRVFDDQGSMYEGTRRLAVQVGGDRAIACAFMARRLHGTATRKAMLAAIRAVAQELSKTKV